MADEHYKYESFGKLFDDLVISLEEYFSPFFSSYGISRKTFIVQTLNLFCVFLISYLLLNSLLLEPATRYLEGSSAFSMKILLNGMIIGLPAVIKGNKIIRWQLIYELGHKMSIYLLGILICLIIAINMVKRHPTVLPKSVQN